MKEQFLNQIEMNPHDDAAKLIYADWLEEQGNPEAEAWRWITHTQRFPKQYDYGKYQWQFVHREVESIDKNTPSHFIPPAVWGNMAGSEPHVKTGIYISILQAFKDVVKGFTINKGKDWP